MTKEPVFWSQFWCNSG